MMPEYIERSAGVSILRAKANMAVLMDAAPYFEKAAQMLEQLPAADVVPVVRCKDCKWFADNNGGEWYGCQMFQVVRITPEDAPKPDDFCSYGEQKDGGASNA